jgi:GTP cyclohydrolase II
VLLYFAQEGRGIGLLNKRQAYQLQDAGFDTLDANEQLGFDADERVYLPAAEMLRQLGFGMVRLLTNNPDKVVAMGRYGIRVVERVSYVFQADTTNVTCAQRGPAAVTLSNRIAAPSRQPTQIAALPPT